jgi:hypothetical protein
MSATWRKERSTVETNEIMNTAAHRSESWCWCQLLSHVLMLVLAQLVCGRPNSSLHESHNQTEITYVPELPNLWTRPPSPVQSVYRQSRDIKEKNYVGYLVRMFVCLYVCFVIHLTKTSVVIQSNENWWIMKGKRCWKMLSSPSLSFYLAFATRDWENLPGRDSKRTPPEYKSEALLLEPASSVHVDLGVDVTIILKWIIYINIQWTCWFYKRLRISWLTEWLMVKLGTPWWPIGLWYVEAPTFCRKSARRRRWGRQPYAPAGRPAALYPQEDSWCSFLLEAESTPGP